MRDVCINKKSKHLDQNHYLSLFSRALSSRGDCLKFALLGARDLRIRQSPHVIASHRAPHQPSRLSPSVNDWRMSGSRGDPATSTSSDPAAALTPSGAAWSRLDADRGRFYTGRAGRATFAYTPRSAERGLRSRLVLAAGDGSELNWSSLMKSFTRSVFVQAINYFGLSIK